MAFIAKRRVKGTNYYSLVKSLRVDGKPRQEVLKHLGRYEDAVSEVSQLRSLSTAVKQGYLTRLAELEGLLDSEVSLPKKAYECIVVDPPWYYGLRKNDKTHRNRIPYEPMQLEEILKLPIPELAAHGGCVLWLWFTNNHILEAGKCIEHWGFEVKTVLTWEKVSKAGATHIGTGHWLRNATEHCILAVRGQVTSFSTTKTLTNQPTIIKSPRREHSRKPDEFYDLVDCLCPNMTKLEMFARQKRPGWDVWGDQTEMFD